MNQFLPKDLWKEKKKVIDIKDKKEKIEKRNMKTKTKKSIPK